MLCWGFLLVKGVTKTEMIPMSQQTHVFTLLQVEELGEATHNAIVGTISDWSPMDAGSACQQQWEFVKIKVMSLGVIPVVTQWNT